MLKVENLSVKILISPISLLKNAVKKFGFDKGTDAAVNKQAREIQKFEDIMKLVEYIVK